MSENRELSLARYIEASPETVGPFMIGVWEIEPQGSGTRFTGRARHWTDEALQQHREMGFEAGWRAAVDQLQALCEG